MDLEQLNKHQIVLLTLLVSFVTSIATGIVTVSLMDHAPPSITKTVNRVVERTIEKTVPAESQGAAATTVTEKVVLIESGGSLENAVASVSEGVMRIYTGDEQTRTFTGYGVVLKDGYVVTGQVDSSTVTLVSFDGVEYDAQKVRDIEGLSYFRAQGDLVLTPSRIKHAKKLSLGTEVFSFTEGSILGFSRMLINQVGENDKVLGTQAGADSSTYELHTVLKTDLAPVVSGLPLFDTDGAIIALSVEKEGIFSFTPIENIIKYAPEA